MTGRAAKKKYAAGLARYEFGVFIVKIFDPVTRRRRAVTRLIHIESGVHFGDFATLDLAKAAGKLADEAIDYNFTDMDARQRSDEFDQIVGHWQAAGLAIRPEYNSSVAIWGLIPSRASFEALIVGEIAWPDFSRSYLSA